MALYSSHERRVLAALSETLFPQGRTLPAGGAHTVAKIERQLAPMPRWLHPGFKSIVWAVELGSVPFHGKPFTRLSPDARMKFLTRWSASNSGPARHMFKGLVTALKAAHFDDEAMFAPAGSRPPHQSPAAESPRWLAQVTDGRTARSDETLEVDVVVVGSGAGGATVAYELASRGHAVAIVEEGRYFRRHEFNRRPAEMTRMMFREMGMTIALGNLSVPVWAGRTVGGTTTINSGTCYRTPERTFRKWREEFGLDMFSRERMDPYFARVERILGVAPAQAAHLGGVATVIARGAGKLGYHHGPLNRNAPDCDGQGVCCFGCPTGAKRSTDVSYIPMALERGAALFSSTRVETIVLENGRARGVLAKFKSGATLRIDASMTVIAGGALMTPVLLERNGVGKRAGQVGRNLSIHPASAVMALFDEPVEMGRAIPQGYCMEQFADEGLMFEGSSTPYEITPIALPFFGPLLIDTMEQYRNLASFGMMIQDTSRGRVRAGPSGKPLITYSLNAHDTARLQRGVEILCDVFFAAGARRVHPCVYGHDVLNTPADLAQMRTRRLRPMDLEVSAYHPLGTARMGKDPATSVVKPDHETHDVEGLYVIDGAAVPSSLGVNPQITIMGMATRAADILDRRLNRAPDDVDAEWARGRSDASKEAAE